MEPLEVLLAQRPKPVEVGEIRARVVRPRGKTGPQDGRWYWRAEIGRRMVWRGWATRSELPRILAEVLLEGPMGNRDLELAEVRTVRDLLDVWLGEVVLPRGDTKQRTKDAVRVSARRVAAGLGDVRLDRLSRLALDQWVAQRQRAEDSSLTIRLDLSNLRRAWVWGQQVGACPRHDLALPRVRAVNARVKRTPTRAEVDRLAEHFNERGPQWVAVILRVQSALGCRIGELTHLTWDRVDLDAGRVVLEGKTGRRAILLTPEIVDVLERLPREHELVLGRSIETTRLVGRFIRPACAELGIEPFTSHGLRRLAVDTLIRSGVKVDVAAAWLGHSPAVMLRDYRQVTEVDLEAAARALSKPRPRGEVVPFPHACAVDERES